MNIIYSIVKLLNKLVGRKDEGRKYKRSKDEVKTKWAFVTTWSKVSQSLITILRYVETDFDPL